MVALARPFSSPLQIWGKLTDISPGRAGLLVNANDKLHLALQALAPMQVNLITVAALLKPHIGHHMSITAA